MALQQYPSFTFNELVVGPRPARTFLVDAAGVVGQFVRGFKGAFACDYQEAKLRYGDRRELNGDVGMNAIYAQGADQFVLSAVFGKAKAANLTVVLKGASSAAGKPTVTFTNSLVDPIKTTAYAPAEDLPIGTKAKAALEAIKAAINADEEAVIEATVIGTDEDARLVLTHKQVGAVLQGKLTAELDAPAGFTEAFPVAGSSVAEKSLADGYDAPAYAELTLTDGDEVDPAPVLKLICLYASEDGNQIGARVKPGSLPHLRTIEVFHKIDGIVEEIRDVDLTDVEDVDLLVASKGKYLFEARVIDAEKTLGITATKTSLDPNDFAYFTGGSSGAPVTTEDYIEAIEALEMEPCSFVLAPGPLPAGVDQEAVEAAIEAHVKNINDVVGEIAGLRVGVLNAPRGMAASDIPDVSVPDTDYLVKVAGWVTPKFAPKLRRFGASPDAFYVGKAMVTPPHVSLAARESSPAYAGIVEVDTPTGSKAWNQITAYRMDAIIKDPYLKVYQALNGRTTASSPKACYWLCFRRMMNLLRMEVFQTIYTKMSEPSATELDEEIQNIVDVRLEQRMKLRQIAGFDKTVSNDTNIPAALRAEGKRIIDLGVELIPPSDHTTVNISRVQRASIRI